MAKAQDELGKTAGRQLEGAADFLEHYHLDHTEDIVTRLRGKGTSIYIVSDPEWKRRIDELIAPIMQKH